jgi:choline dehydrogenase-like flavoprotein
VADFDALVLGGGPAGCVLAARLSEDANRRVVLVEAGPDYGPRAAGRWPAELLDASVIPESHDWSDGDESLPWARVIGGCSAHNACGVIHGAPAEIDSWASWGGSEWTWAALEPCLRRARETLGTRRQDREGLSVWHSAMLAAAGEAGLPALDDLDEPRPGAGVLPVNADGGVRRNAAFSYLDPARSRPNLTIAGGTLADRVLLEGGRVTGAVVRDDDGERELRAPLVVLTAGAYGSPAILLRSGVGPEAELDPHDIPVAHHLPGVGTELSDHARAGIGFAFSEDAAAATRDDPGVAAQALVKWRSSLVGEDVCDVQFLGFVPSARDQGRITVGLLAPRSQGRVGLQSRDPARLPRVEDGFLTDPEGHDLAVVVEGLEQVRALGATAALRAVTTGEVDPGQGVDVADHARDTVATYYHPTGTCRMGAPDDPGAVVDGFGRVHGVDGLRVADASIVPVSPRANTHLTALGVAERVAELIRAG